MFAEFSFHEAALEMIDSVYDVADIPCLSSWLVICSQSSVFTAVLYK